MEVSFKASPLYGIDVGGGCDLGQAGRKILVAPNITGCLNHQALSEAGNACVVSKQMQQSLINCEVLISCL
jgi:hypothetical protein